MGRLKGHTRFRKGERVLVVLRNGTRVVDQFQARKSRYLHFSKLGRVPSGEIEFVTIYMQKER